MQSSKLVQCLRPDKSEANESLALVSWMEANRRADVGFPEDELGLVIVFPDEES